MIIKKIVILAALSFFLTPCDQACGVEPVKVGSKKFTESVILGEIVSGVLNNSGYRAEHVRELGGTRVLWEALVKGRIDIYPEYTGTIIEEILIGREIAGEDAFRAALSRYGIGITGSLGFSDNYAIGMREDTCRRLGIRRISDLRVYPNLIFGFSNEFMSRKDGWPGLRKKYGLRNKKVFGLDHDIAYRALAAGSIDATDLYTTDAEISYYGLCALKDDRSYFPEYSAVLLYRDDLRKRAPGISAALARLEGTITGGEMSRMNEKAKIEKMPEGEIASDFLSQYLSLPASARMKTAFDEIRVHTREHLFLVSVSMLAALLVALPLGILAEKRPRLGQLVLGFAGIIQTIPSLALLVFMIPLLGIGGPPAIVALFLYSLLPIVRNTCDGLRSISPEIRESASALGLTYGAKLRLIELPMASREILAGIKTSAVINVGTATLGALIGAGGYGQPILTGIRLDDIGLILQGAVPAALLALSVQGAFGLAEKVLIPKGLRLKSEE